MAAGPTPSQRQGHIHTRILLIVLLLATFQPHQLQV